jgi:hypothetical protein
MKDALGNEIVMDGWYGYTQSNNGFSHITIGKAFKETPTGLLTLSETQIWRVGYRDSKIWAKESGKKVTVRSFMTFPVDITTVSHEVDPNA